MNLANKITIGRIILTVIIIGLLIFPFNSVGISFPVLFINEQLPISSKNIIVGVLFIIASLTDFLDGYVARKYNMVTDFGKMVDAIADKMLVNSVIIILASTGAINVIIPVVIVVRDIVVDTIKMIAGSKGKVIAAIKSGKIKTACLMVGVTLTLFDNLPFELINIRVADILLVVATVMAIVSGVQYYQMNKKLIFSEK
ncbi:MAG TPA: CDP-diacylglycerol--glycerol-3-phosphate 3-phosphatidyltransferase [Bacilli bacterium]|nr:CDP-diacylglycerol--glycerol-3-phosphate 3-phosphatidyltransferase [Bacilli bacterium]